MLSQNSFPPNFFSSMSFSNRLMMDEEVALTSHNYEQTRLHSNITYAYRGA